MTTDYKLLSKELYETLKQVRNLIDDANGNPISRWDKTMPRVDAAIDYEQETTEGTGRTTALYMKAITEALENPGKTIDFIDHYPHTRESSKDHTINLRNIIKKLGYAIDVNLIGTEICLYNRF